MRRWRTAQRGPLLWRLDCGRRGANAGGAPDCAASGLDRSVHSALLRSASIRMLSSERAGCPPGPALLRAGRCLRPAIWGFVRPQPVRPCACCLQKFDAGQYSFFGDLDGGGGGGLDDDLGGLDGALEVSTVTLPGAWPDPQPQRQRHHWLPGHGCCAAALYCQTFHSARVRMMLPKHDVHSHSQRIQAAR